MSSGFLDVILFHAHKPLYNKGLQTPKSINQDSALRINQLFNQINPAQKS